MKRRIRHQPFTMALSLHFWNGAGGSLFFMVLSLCLIVFSVTRSDTASDMRTGLSDAMVPFLGAVQTPVDGFFYFLQDLSELKTLREDNDALRAENNNLRDWYHKARTLEHENAALRSLVGVDVPAMPLKIGARVMADSGTNYAQSLIVNKGASDGVKNAQGVMSGQGLAGRVIEVGKNTSRVLLLTDLNSRVPVIVEGSGERSILMGDNGPYPRLLHLPEKAVIEDGARLVTSGHGGIFVPNLPVGSVFKDDQGQYRAALYADFDRMVFVKIIVSQDNYIPSEPKVVVGEDEELGGRE